MARQYRADQVGSFLRPPELREAHTGFTEGKLSLDTLREMEDEAILAILEMQRQSGIDVLSDGEFRRSGWGSDFRAAVDGYIPGTPAVRVIQHRLSDGTVLEQASGSSSAGRTGEMTHGRPQT